MVLWSSNTRRTINVFIVKLVEPDIELIEETEWVARSKVCDFLKVEAEVTKTESDTFYVTISMATKTVDYLLRVCKKESTCSSSTLKDDAKRMLIKLQKYSALVHSSIANTCEILVSRFLNEIVCDNDVLQSFVPIVQKKDIDRCSENTVQFRSFLERLLDEDSFGCLRVVGDDEILSFLKTTAVVDSKATPLLMWKLNELRLPSIVVVAKDVFSIQASSIGGKSGFSEGVALIDRLRNSMSEDSIKVCMLSRS